MYRYSDGSRIYKRGPKTKRRRREDRGAEEDEVWEEGVPHWIGVWGGGGAPPQKKILDF